MMYTTKKTVVSDGIFGRIRICLNFSDGFGTVLTERNFRLKSVPKLCENFSTCSNKVFSHGFRTDLFKKTIPSQNRVKYWDGFRTANIFEGFNWENFISRLSHKISLVCFSHNPKISSPSFITLKPTSKSISQCGALQSTSPVLLFNQFLPKTSQAGQSIFQGIQDSLLFSPDLWIVCIFF
jgi:hypothetical protein